MAMTTSPTSVTIDHCTGVDRKRQALPFSFSQNNDVVNLQPPFPNFEESMSNKRLRISSDGHDKNIIVASESQLLKASEKSTSFDVRTLAPTLMGIRNASKSMINGQLLAIPTETVYMMCSTIPKKKILNSNDDSIDASNQLTNILTQMKGLSQDYQQEENDKSGAYIFVRQVKELEDLIDFKSRAYALKKKPRENEGSIPSLSKDEHSPTLSSQQEPIGAAQPSSPSCSTTTTGTMMMITPMKGKKSISDRLQPQPFYPSPLIEASSPSPTYPSNDMSPLPPPLLPMNLQPQHHTCSISSYRSISSTSITDNVVAPCDVIAFHEGREVLRRLSSRYWPGPVTMYLNTNSKTTKTSSIPTSLLHTLSKQDNTGTQYVGIKCSSHPLTCRTLKETTKESRNRNAIIGVPLSHDSTSAAKVGTNLMSSSKQVTMKEQQQPSRQQTIVNIINGEDQREMFAVPTCQYGETYKLSLWIDDSKRTIHIVGGKTKDHSDYGINEKSILQALLQNPPPPTPPLLQTQKQQQPSVNIDPILFASSLLLESNQADIDKERKLKHRQRVIYSVMCKWKVIDHR